jgi:hypothetical protein
VGGEVPAAHVLFPTVLYDFFVQVEVEQGGGVYAVGFHDFEGLGEKGGDGAGSACPEEAEEGGIFDGDSFGHKFDYKLWFLGRLINN